MTHSLEKSLCASLDILGFAQAMEKAYSAGKSEQLLDDIEAALAAAVAGITPSSGSAIWTLKFFSDNLVVGYPCYFPGTPMAELHHLCQILGRYQLTMASKGFFIRGGISFGTLANTDKIIFGDALVKAHELESLKACNPRVILDPQVLELLKSGSPSPASTMRGSFDRLLLQDADGYCFINYLNEIYDNHRNLVTISGQGPCLVVNQEELVIHRKQIERHLTETQKIPRVWSKYFWVANYHNSFCDLNNQTNQKVCDKFLRPQPVGFTSS